MHKPSVVLSAIIALGISSTVVAECDKGTKTVFSCLTGQAKLIEVCDSGKTIDYSFGRPRAKPEIVVRVPRNQASTTQWRGVGPFYYTVEIPNGDTTYSVFWSAERYSPEHRIEAGVNVEVSTKLVATVNCVGESNIVNNIQGIDLKATR